MEDKLKQAVLTYNKIAKLYAEFNKDKLMQFQLNKFISLLPKKAKVLDAGCGPGRDAEYMHEDGMDVTGIDISEGMVEEAKKRVPKITFKVMDMRSLTFKDATFDGIWAMASLFNIPKEEIPKVLKEFKRVLKPDGIVFIAVKEGEGEKIIKKPKYNHEPIYMVFFNQQELEEFLTDAGFEIAHSITSKDENTTWIEIFAKNRS